MSRPPLYRTELLLPLIIPKRRGVSINALCQVNLKKRSFLNFCGQIPLFSQKTLQIFPCKKGRFMKPGLF
ncbi:hypothetical protein BaLi_c07400 [Bacillus paralicheniformis ATCC 9945a]|nr:hypothetical protein BaLi_c07400 [Bacillus paralicheniformis ATCC 9945a]